MVGTPPTAASIEPPRARAPVGPAAGSVCEENGEKKKREPGKSEKMVDSHPSPAFSAADWSLMSCGGPCLDLASVNPRELMTVAKRVKCGRQGQCTLPSLTLALREEERKRRIASGRLARAPPEPTPGRPQEPATWLILPVVICLSQRLSHACLSTSSSRAKLRMAH